MGNGVTCVRPDDTVGYPLPFSGQEIADSGGGVSESGASCFGAERWTDVDPSLAERPYAVCVESVRFAHGATLDKLA